MARGYAYRSAPTADSAANGDPAAAANNNLDDTADNGKSADGCCVISCLKFAIHLFNCIFFLSGVVLVGVGVWTILEKHPSLVLLTSGLYDLTGYVLIFAGCIILVTTVVGCCGLSRNSHRAVLAYATLLSVIFLTEATVGAVAYFYRTALADELEINLRQKFAVEYGAEAATTEAVDVLQQQLSCCGVASFEDWRETDWWSSAARGNNLVPDSCCITPSPHCGVRDHPSNVRYTGCADRVARIAGDHLVVVGAVAVGVCLIQLVGTVLACLLHCKLKELTHYG